MAGRKLGVSRYEFKARLLTAVCLCISLFTFLTLSLLSGNKIQLV